MQLLQDSPLFHKTQDIHNQILEIFVKALVESIYDSKSDSNINNNSLNNNNNNNNNNFINFSYGYSLLLNELYLNEMQDEIFQLFKIFKTSAKNLTIQKSKPTQYQLSSDASIYSISHFAPIILEQYQKKNPNFYPSSLNNKNNQLSNEYQKIGILKFIKLKELNIGILIIKFFKKLKKKS
ncbi:hypothetical protein ACTFIR_012746 [Dictyostelium discoideum]